MSSFINLFIYEVKGPTRLLYPTKDESFNHLYSFNKLSLKKNTNTSNNPIIPIELRESAKLRNNIIKISKNAEVKFNANIIKLQQNISDEYNESLKLQLNEEKQKLIQEKQQYIEKYCEEKYKLLIGEYYEIIKQPEINTSKLEKKLKIKISELKYLINLIKKGYKNLYISSKNIIKTNNRLLFSKNILKNINNNNNEINIKLYNKNIPFLYKIYKTLPARLTINKILNYNTTLTSELRTTIYSKMKTLFDDNTLIFKNYFNNKKRTFIFNSLRWKINESSEIIYTLNENEDCNIILTGDNHGSFHSFFRIILRLYIKGIIKKDYTLKENYKLILLGDIVDRGNYGIELLYILLNLMKKNNNQNNLNVILLRGNHEEYKTYSEYGFEKEYTEKLNKSNNVKNTIKNFFTYCPSAIILNHLNTRYWLCHGGFDITYKKYEIIKTNINNKKNLAFIFDINNASQIRWNDFNGKDEDKCSNRNACHDTMFYIGNKSLFNFLSYLNIDFIIRGHNDDYSNAMILKQNNSDNISNKYYVLNNKDFYYYYISNENENNNALNYGNKNNSLKYIDEIVSINPKKFQKIYITIKNNKVYPVLTISNNSDRDRRQYSDSFLIISKKEENKNFIRKPIISNNNEEVNNIRNTITNYNNYEKIMKNIPLSNSK